MRKTLFIAAMLCLTSFFAQAQYDIIDIHNSTSCTVYVQILGTTNSNGCASDYQSSFIAIPPFSGTVYTDPSMVPGGVQNASMMSLAAGDKFTGIKVVSDNPGGSCSIASSVLMSDCLASSTTAAIAFPINTASCTSCGTHDILYNAVGNIITLEIN